MAERIHLVLDAAEKERFRVLAARAGLTLSEWLRQAAEERAAAQEAEPALDSTSALEAFFADCDGRERASEPDWEEHRARIERSIDRGAAEP